MTRSSAPPGTVLSVAPAQARRDSAAGPGADVADGDVPGGVLTSAVDCARIGAAVVDLLPHPGCTEIVAALRERTELLIRTTALPDSDPSGLLDAGPHIVSCPLDAPGSFAADLRAGARERGIAVHYEARTPADLAALREIPQPAHVVLVFGAGLTGDVPGFAAAVAEVPEGTSGTATGLGESGIPMLLTALAAGWHVRTGLADHPGYAPGTAARDDAQLVARAAGIAKIAGRPPVPPAHAAPMLGIKT